MSEHPPGLFPLPGDGGLARIGDLVLLCSLDGSPTADDLLDLQEQVAAAGGDGRQFTDAIADLLGSSDSSLSVLAFGPAGAGLALAISGGAWADVTTPEGTARIEARHPSLLLRGTLRSSVTGVRGGLGPGGGEAASFDRFSRLDAGTVRAGGLSYRPDGAGAPPSAGRAGVGAAAASPRAAAAEPPPAAAPAAVAPSTPEGLERQAAAPPAPEPPAPEPAAPVPPAPEPAAPVPPAPEPAFDPVQPFEAVMLLGAGAGVDAPVREPLAKVSDVPPGSSSYVSAGPIIEGVYCKNGHFDDPEARFCAVCGISMNQQTLTPGRGERPPLGVLLLDDGSVFQLDGDYVVGREPTLDSAVAGGSAKALPLYDDSGIVSRVHARVQLDGWRVLVTDLGSANGTRVLMPGQPPPGQPLAPQVPVVLATGSQVDLGGRGFRYESHRGR